MRTNTDAGVNTEFEIDDIVKPKNMNALAQSVPYDYVVTQAMLAGKSGDVDVDALLGGNKIHGVTGEYHVLINAVVPNTITLCFPSTSVGGPSGLLRVHIHTICAVNAKVTGMASTLIYHYFHTSGTDAPVTLYSLGSHTYVGAYEAGTLPFTVPNGGTFIYENAVNGTVPSGSGATVRLEYWMTNNVHITGHHRAVAVLLDYDRIHGGAGGAQSTVPSGLNPVYRTVWRTENGHVIYKALGRTGIGTTLGEQTQMNLVPRAKPEYNGYLYPSSILDGAGALQWKGRNNIWTQGSSLFMTFARKCIGCAVDQYGLSWEGPNLDNGELTTGVTVDEDISQLDIYTTIGYRTHLSDGMYPRLKYAICLDYMDRIPIGQVVELNIHVVGLPPIRQPLHSQLGIEHFLADYNTTKQYYKGDMCLYEGHAWEWQKNAAGNSTPAAGADWIAWDYSGPEEWNAVPEMFPAIPGDSESPRLSLQFRAGNNNIVLPIYAWGYGVPISVVNDDKPIDPQNNEVIYPSFQQPFASRAVDVYAPGTLGYGESMPIIGTSKIVFARLPKNGQSCIVLLNGAYSTGRPCRRDDRNNL